MNNREYAKANLDWLAAKAEEEDVIALPEGIYYKVLSSGNNDGKHPTPRSIVTAHYTCLLYTSDAADEQLLV